MKLKKEESTYVSPKVGLTHGVITSYVTVGTTDDKFNPGKTKSEVMIVITLVKQHQSFDDDREPEMLTISKWFRASLNEKSNLYKFVSSLMKIEDEFDLDTLLGVNCMVHLVAHKKDNGDETIIINSVAPLMEGTDAIELETFKFDFEDFKEVEFEALSDRMQERIKLTPEWKAISYPA